MTTSADGRVAAPATRPVRQGIAPRTATVGLYVADSALQAAVVARGCDVACWRNPLFTSPKRADRLKAELLCPGCPVFGECDRDATDHDEHHHVWAGLDRTPGAHPLPEDLL